MQFLCPTPIQLSSELPLSRSYLMLLCCKPLPPTYNRHRLSYRWLCNFVNHSSTVNHSYSLGLLPEECIWGKHCALADCSAFLCSSDGCHQITVWTIGKIMDTAFETNREPLKMVGIQVKLLMATRGHEAKQIIGKKGFPVNHMFRCPLLSLN